MTSDAAAPRRPELTRCWRCGKDVSWAADTCPHCEAPRRRRADRQPGGARSLTAPMTGTMVLFGVLLATSLAYGALSSFGVEQSGSAPARPQHELRTMIGFELVDVVVVGVGLLLLGRPPRRPRLGVVPRPLVWAAAVLGIVAVVGVNHGYHTLLRTYLGVQPARDSVVAANGITPLLLLAYCVEPAVLEEVFFRYLLLDTLRGVTGVHLSVAISSLMFGLAHIGVPLSIPMLALVGVPLAYARVTSGSLALPMLLHFLHNLLVVVRS